MGEPQKPRQLHRLRFAKAVSLRVPQRQPRSFCGAVVNKFPLIHTAKPGEIARQLIHAMLHHQDGHVIFLIQRNQKFQEIPHALGIHLAHRFIEDEQLRMGHQHRRQGEALPLPAGEGVDASLLHAGEAGLFQRFFHFFCNALRRLAAIFQREAHFVSHSHGEKLIVRRLVHRPHQETDILRRHGERVLPVQEDAPRQLRFLFFQKPSDGLDERRFPAARAAGDEHHFPFRERQIHMRERLPLAGQIAARKVLYVQYHDPITCFKRLPTRKPIQLPSELYKSPFMII